VQLLFGLVTVRITLDLLFQFYRKKFTLLLVLERKEYFDLYQAHEISLNFLQAKAPFIAYEMERQGMI